MPVPRDVPLTPFIHSLGGPGLACLKGQSRLARPAVEPVTEGAFRDDLSVVVLAMGDATCESLRGHGGRYVVSCAPIRRCTDGGGSPLREHLRCDPCSRSPQLICTGFPLGRVGIAYA